MSEISVSAQIAAPAETVYDLVSDVRRMGEWSPECRRCVWRGERRGPVAGARFRGYNRNGVHRWYTDARVAVAERGREFAFDVTTVLGLPVARWGYRIQPAGDACTVTEYTEDRRGLLVRAVGRIASGVPDRTAHNREGMRRTLEMLGRAAQRGGDTPVTAAAAADGDPAAR